MSSTESLVVRAEEIEPFVLPTSVGVYESQCLIDKDGVGSENLNVNRGILKAGRKLKGGGHPVSNDECYYVLRGRAGLALGGDPKTGDGSTLHDLEPDVAVFIPRGTFHALDNPYDEDPVILTMWPKLPPSGANGIYDERKRHWGTTFRKEASVAR